MHPLVHLVAHTRRGFADVVRWESAVWLWTHLRDTFPEAMAASLMPDHLHLLVLLRAYTLEALRRVLQHHARRFGAAWDIGPPTPVHTRQILRRTSKYIYLNATRDGLVDDPLCWPWSTLRDAVGATADPWGGPAVVASALDLPPRSIHRFATADPSCDPRARSPIAVLHPSTGLAVNLAAVGEACASALRCHPSALQRKGSPIRPVFVEVARSVATPRVTDLARACAITPRALAAVRRRAASVPAAVRAARRCLGDPRLRIWDVDAR